VVVGELFDDMYDYYSRVLDFFNEHQPAVYCARILRTAPVHDLLQE
jgi:hypothetical protein